MGNEKISALFLTKYSREGASTRYRFLQYFPSLEACGIECHASALTDGKYLEHLYAEGRCRVSDAVGSALGRLGAILSARRYDIIIVEYEIMPYFPPVFEAVLARSGIPFIVNYDDAIFYRYSLHPNPVVRGMLGKKIDSVMRLADLVIAGNDYLAEHARMAGARRIETMPTVVDITRYPGKPAGGNRIFTIGWIGSPSTRKYLGEIAPALSEVCSGAKAKLLLIGSGGAEIPGVPVEERAWSEATEVRDLEACDVGIMPLHDGPWEQGKCGLKLIQYMACGLPVVVTPIGVNRRLVEPGVNGYYAEDMKGWVDGLAKLRDDPALRNRMGSAGRRKVEESYSLQVTAPRLAELIRQTASRSKKA